MPDINTTLSALLRPRLLVRAARHALTGYNRKRHLPRLIEEGGTHPGTRIALRLADMEADLDEKRCARDASYSPARHIDVLTALIAEAEMLSHAAILCAKRPAKSALA